MELTVFGVKAPQNRRGLSEPYNKNANDKYSIE
jgi:hypothetical protein